MKAKKIKQPVTVWQAYQITVGNVWGLVGYIVAPSGDPNKPIGIVYFSDDMPRERECAYKTAVEVAKDPSRMSTMGFLGQDLRDRPLPPWLWSLHVSPGDDEDAEAVPLDPFCPYLLAKLIDRFCIEEGRPEWVGRTSRRMVAVDTSADGSGTGDWENLLLPNIDLDDETASD